MASPPTGTVTFLFTDIEGSTPLLQRLGDEPYSRLLTEHHRLLREACTAARGYLVETQGDAFLVAFHSAHDAVAAATSAQHALATHAWPDGVALRVRMGLHTGEPLASGAGYVGLDLHRVARIAQAGWGGQILLSQVTRDLVAGDLPAGTSLVDLGVHRLKGVQREERLYQLQHPDLQMGFPPLQTLDVLPNNLPRQLTSFIGREREMAEIRQLLSSNRLVTLTGSGGCGKTRLALQIAADLIDAYPDGVWLVELATLADPALVPQVAASVFPVREQPGRAVLTTLTEHLQRKRLLIVLDNCEHVVGASAQLAEALLRACPDLRLLATSRERLGVAGEAAYRVPSMSLPDLERLPPFEVLTQSEAVRLFGERAAAVSPGFQVTPDSAPLMAHICHRLDGIPLAIELAAARVNVLSLDQIALRLNDRFRLLVGGSRTAPSRQQTLRAALDWSYVLLPERERVLLCRLSVFAGGCSLEAAEAVCAGDGIERTDVLDLLTQLIDKSLVIVDEDGGNLRYRLLETVRQYAWDRLLESEQETPTRARHLAWFLDTAERAEAELRGPDQAAWLAHLETEHDNLRAALEWSRGDTRFGETGLRLAAALGRFWWMRGHFAEGRSYTEGLLTARTHVMDATRARALLEAGRLAWAQGDVTAAGDRLRQSLVLFEALHDLRGTADALNMLGLAAWVQSDYAAARSRYEDGLRLARELGDRRRTAAILNSLGLVAMAQGDYAFAKELLDESLATVRDLGDTHAIAYAVTNLGLVAAAMGDHDLAQIHFEEGLRIRRERGDRLGVVHSLINLSLVAHRKGEDERSAQMVEEALGLARELNDRQGIADAKGVLARLAGQKPDQREAAALWKESLAIRHELGDKRGMAECLEGLAGVAVAEGAFTRGGRLLGAAKAIRSMVGAPLAPVDEHARTLWTVTAHMGDEFGVPIQDGASIPLGEIVRYAISDEA